jgi:hypothetical protein
MAKILRARIFTGSGRASLLVALAAVLALAPPLKLSGKNSSRSAPAKN